MGIRSGIWDSLPARLYRSRGLLWNLILLDVRTRYAGSLLGFLWFLALPFLYLACFVWLYGFVLKIQADAPFDYAIMVFTGLLPFLGFSEGLSRGTASVTANVNLVKSVIFPIEYVPLITAVSSLGMQLAGTALLLAALLVQGKLTLAVLLLPVPIVLQVVFTAGAVWFLSALNVVFRDVIQVVSILLLLLMFVSPIGYTRQAIPGNLQLASGINPLYYLIGMYRDVLLEGRAPSGTDLMVFGLLAAVACAIGYAFFTRLKPAFADLV